MARYRPPKVDTFQRGERGEALVKFAKKNGKTYVMVKFEETGAVFRFPRTRDIASLKPGRWYIALNGTEDEIWNYHPWSGQYKVKVAQFTSKEGEPPTPKVIEGPDWTTIQFTVILEVLEPEKLAGVRIPYNLKYNFREAKEDKGSFVGLASRGSRTKQLADFLDITGAWNRGPMKWMDNVLPAFEKRILHENVTFGIIIKDGWIDTVYETGEPEIASDDDWEDEPAEVAEEETLPDKLPWDEE